MEYEAFLASKAPRAMASGIEPGPMPGHLFDFQADGCAFMLRAGRALGAYDTGLGKGRMALECLRQAGMATNGVTAHIVPLAVSWQIVKEGLALGYTIHIARTPEDVKPGINVITYERVKLFDPRLFGAVSLDESDILASLTGAMAQMFITMFAETRFRFCWSATPAPNDHTELGAHAEFLGVMRSQEMLSRWFINDTSTASQDWRLKGHAVEAFWDWVATWARCAESPYDLGFDGSAFVLSPYEVFRHKVEAEIARDDGTLFGTDLSATTMHAMKQKTASVRADLARDLVMLERHEPWLLWCDSDAEANALQAVLPDAAEIRGSHTPERKEQTIIDFIEGRKKWLISKPSILGAGLNFQHCARNAYVGRSFSYKRFYQSLRRTWRFGQKRQVHVHLIVAEGEDQIGRIIDRKSADHTTMKQAMAKAMMRSRGIVKAAKPPLTLINARLPSWL